MHIELVNGSVVSRLWVGSESSSTEFIAAFQYTSDAKLFVQNRVSEDEKRDFFNSRVIYIVTCLYSGKTETFGTKPKVEGEKP